jgi:hypothetical protein
MYSGAMYQGPVPLWGTVAALAIVGLVILIILVWLLHHRREKAHLHRLFSESSKAGSPHEDDASDVPRVEGQQLKAPFGRPHA